MGSSTSQHTGNDDAADDCERQKSAKRRHSDEENQKRACGKYEPGNPAVDSETVHGYSAMPVVAFHSISANGSRQISIFSLPAGLKTDAMPLFLSPNLCAKPIPAGHTGCMFSLAQHRRAADIPT
jgi:hypothetical protein